MNRVAETYDADVTPRRELAMIAVQGPNAREKVFAVRPEWRAPGESLGVFFRCGNRRSVSRPHRLHR